MPSRISPTRFWTLPIYAFSPLATSVCFTHPVLHFFCLCPVGPSFQRSHRRDLARHSRRISIFYAGGICVVGERPVTHEKLHQRGDEKLHGCVRGNFMFLAGGIRSDVWRQPLRLVWHFGLCPA